MHSATIKAGDGTVVATGVPIELSQGSRSWKGVFSHPGGAFKVGEYFTVELDDGRSGQMLISTIRAASNATPRIQFDGDGPLG
ncbi:MAG TPA: hypothetical protein VGG64_17370 [Pirellulales bacterium]|jgi:hypothetical protein